RRGRDRQRHDVYRRRQQRVVRRHPRQQRVGRSDLPLCRARLDGDPLTPAQAGVQKSQIAALGPRFRGDERRLRCQLICIDPAQAHEFWPHVASLIRAAMEKGRLSSYADVERAVRNGHALLWLAWNGETVKAAAVAELTRANGETFCTIVACGGHDRSQWL